MVFDYLLIGGGLASASAAETLRKEGAGGTIAIISDEELYPYHRPPLSKNFLIKNLKSEDIIVYDESFYKNNNIDVLLGTKVLTLCPQRKMVETDNQGSIRYGKLLIATGSRVKKLNVPGSNLRGIYYLRNISDAESIQRATSYSKKAVVVGSGFIGMELASVFAQMGIRTTIISRGKNLLARLGSREISNFFENYYKNKGVDIISGDTVKEFQGTRHVNRIVTERGKTISCDIVAVGIGVVPETAFLESSGVSLDNGIIVDKSMQTNFQEIYAAGDVTRFYDPLFRAHRRVEHWDNAVKQGKIASKNMLGKKDYYNEVSYFFSDVFDLSFDFLGYSSNTDERIVNGSIADKSFSVYYLKSGILRAGFLLNRSSSEADAVRDLIRNRVNVGKNKSRLASLKIPTEKVIAQ
ncbi:MAG: FAD/NAD(P)-binding oxidoreductase [Deltaproteobacteria bacterium]